MAAGAWQVHGGNSGYVGSASCAECHSDIYHHFLQTSMGRSMSRIKPSTLTPTFLQSLSLPAHSFDQKMDRHYETFTRDGKLYQSEYQTTADGAGIFRDTHEIDWMIGAGTNGIGAIVRRGDYLFQAPRSFYSKPKTWGPSPGYEQVDLGFNRPIQAG